MIKLCRLKWTSHILRDMSCLLENINSYNSKFGNNPQNKCKRMLCGMLGNPIIVTIVIEFFIAKLVLPCNL